MERIRIGIMGGTGIYKLPGITDLKKVKVDTEYGEVIVNVGTLAGKKVAFLTRHGEHHSISPSNINFMANIQAMQKLGVKQLLATACCGSVNPEYGIGSFVLIKQFLDFTKNRKASFFDNDGTVDKKIAHIDLTHPYCDRLGEYVLKAGREINLHVKSGATYCCMEGPRYECAAEIKMFRTLGGDLVAHTQYPEVALAREAEMCYTAIAIVPNMAAGIEDDHVSSRELKRNMSALFETTQSLLTKTVELLPNEEDCWCQHALEEAFI